MLIDITILCYKETLSLCAQNGSSFFVVVVCLFNWLSEVCVSTDVVAWEFSFLYRRSLATELELERKIPYKTFKLSFIYNNIINFIIFMVNCLFNYS